MTTTESTENQNFGAWLKAQREERKVSLEEIAAVTKIHISQLHNLESGDQQKLPAAAFIRGFLVSYARHLSLDVDEVLARYREWRGPLANDSQLIIPQGSRVAQSATHPKVRMVTTPNFQQAPGTKDLEEHVSRMPPLKTSLTIAGAVVVLIVLAFLVSLGRQRRKEREAEKVQQSAQVTTPASGAAAPSAAATGATPPTPNAEKGPETKAAEVKTPAPTPTPAATPASASKSSFYDPAKKYQLEIHALEQSWVNVRLDDGESRGIPLKTGGQYHFSADRRVSLSLSNAGGVELRWNGQWYESPGFRGDVKSLTFPEQISTLTARSAPRPPRVPKPAAATTPAATSTPPATPTTPPAASGDTSASP